MSDKKNKCDQKSSVIQMHWVQFLQQEKQRSHQQTEYITPKVIYIYTKVQGFCVYTLSVKEWVFWNAWSQKLAKNWMLSVLEMLSVLNDEAFCSLLCNIKWVCTYFNVMFLLVFSPCICKMSSWKRHNLKPTTRCPITNRLPSSCRLSWKTAGH